MKKIIYFIWVFIPSIGLFAQQDPMISQYMFNGNLINPAYAGSHPYPNVTMMYRQQWVGFAGAPTSYFASFDTPLNGKNVGLGLQIANDKIGVSEQTYLNGNYSYHLKMGNGKLAMGLSSSLTYSKAYLSELKVWDANDDVYKNNTSTSFTPNFGAGLYYYSTNYYLGISAPHIINYDPNTSLHVTAEKAPHQVRHYYITGGYVYTVNEDFIIKPSLLLKYVAKAPFQADVNLNVLLKKVLWLGASYRTGDSFVGMIGFQINNRLHLGYAHDFTITPLQDYNSGTHEIILSYDFGKEAIKMKTPRFF